MKRVFAAGTFDGLHPGHVKYLSFARKQGDELVVVVARDSTLKRLGKKHYFNETERLGLVSSLSIVDEARLGDEHDFLKSVERVRPDVIVLGHDQKVNVRELAKKLSCKGLSPRVMRCAPYSRRKYKTGRLKAEKPRFHKEV